MTRTDTAPIFQSFVRFLGKTALWFNPGVGIPRVFTVWAEAADGIRRTVWLHWRRVDDTQEPNAWPECWPSCRSHLNPSPIRDGEIRFWLLRKIWPWQKKTPNLLQYDDIPQLWTHWLINQWRPLTSWTPDMSYTHQPSLSRVTLYFCNSLLNDF